VAQLLRVGEPLSLVDAVVAESWVYGLLQGGGAHRGWLFERSDRRRRPRPDGAVVEVGRHDDVLAVTLDRPEVRNAYGARMRDELVAALQVARVDPTITRVELRGAGPAFCSGGDLDEFGTAPDPADAHVVRTTRNAGIQLAGLAERVTAYVHGACVGAGVELPAFVSEVVARSDATFRLPEIAMGLVPGAGGTASIPRRVGRHRATHLALRGRPIDAATALAWGLVDRIDDAAFDGEGLSSADDRPEGAAPR
jgi:enoyl-CoA hydratase/carnithine racemase